MKVVTFFKIVKQKLVILVIISNIPIWQRKDHRVPPLKIMCNTTYTTMDWFVTNEGFRSHVSHRYQTKHAMSVPIETNAKWQTPTAIDWRHSTTIIATYNIAELIGSKTKMSLIIWQKYIHNSFQNMGTYVMNDNDGTICSISVL